MLLLFAHFHPFNDVIILNFPVPESHFKLNYRTDFDGMVHIKCSAFNVFPEPKLSLKYVTHFMPHRAYHNLNSLPLYSPSSINNVELKSEVKVAKDIRDGLFDVKVIAKYPKNALKSETIINCQLTMLGTHYSKKQETVYYGKLNIIFVSKMPHFLCS